MDTLFCTCCGRPFRRASRRGPSPLYCSRDCRRQMDVRRRVWASLDSAPAVWGQPRDHQPPLRHAGGAR